MHGGERAKTSAGKASRCAGVWTCSTQPWCHHRSETFKNISHTDPTLATQPRLAQTHLRVDGMHEPQKESAVDRLAERLQRCRGLRQRELLREELATDFDLFARHGSLRGVVACRRWGGGVRNLAAP